MSSSVQSTARHFDTIVIGAGVSGLACAARLFQHHARNGGSSLAVLEARERIGGRVGSVYVNGKRLDTGANWIHGIGTDDSPNPLMSILPHKRYRPLSGSVAFRPPDDNAIISKPSGDHGLSNGWENVIHESPWPKSTADLVIPAEVAGPLMGAMWETIGSLHEKAGSVSADEAKKTRALDAIGQSQTFTEAFKEVPSEYHIVLKGLPQFIENMEAAPLAAQSAEHTQDLPGMSLVEYAIDDFDGDQVFLEDGYTAVVDELATELVEAGCIKLGIEVTEINWTTKPITVETTAGQFFANQVVCTLPLGVLKHQQHRAAQGSRFFVPELPKEKREAIASLGFGTLDKIFLIYEQPWWKSEPYSSIWEKGLVRRPLIPPDDGNDENQDLTDKASQPDSLMGFTNELAGIEIAEDGTVSSGPRVLSAINLENLTGFPVLSTFVSCNNATYVEGLSDAHAGAIVHRALSQWFGCDPPMPEAVHVTRWAQDPFSRGSYSHMITGLSENRHREVFHQPLLNRQGAELRFAGEHTSSNSFATVHGALLSGWREADAILKGAASTG